MIFKNSEKGVSLIITFFIMIIILSIVLAISILLYSEIKVVKNMGNSVVSFYAADSGVEKVLYYDKQVIPVLEDGKIATRGLCSIFASCVDTLEAVDEPSIFCRQNLGYVPGLINKENGCDPEICDDCTISFDTILDSSADENSFDDITYSVTATVNSSYYLNIKSNGAYGNTGRQIETFNTGGDGAKPVEDVIIMNACATPEATSQGLNVTIRAEASTTVIDGYSINSVVATIYHYDPDFGGVVVDNPGLALRFASGVWSKDWNTMIVGSYHVDLTATDNKGNTKTAENIPSCSW